VKGAVPTCGYFFLFSVHNFPPIPWHTVDGIAFSALGIFLIAGRNSVFSSVIGMVALVLGALTKQSFYPMPLMGLASVFFLRRKHLWLVLRRQFWLQAVFCSFWR
jgi:hypothetical protein